MLLNPFILLEESVHAWALFVGNNKSNAWCLLRNTVNIMFFFGEILWNIGPFVSSYVKYFPRNVLYIRYLWKKYRGICSVTLSLSIISCEIYSIKLFCDAFLVKWDLENSFCQEVQHKTLLYNTFLEMKPVQLFL